jgi:periplasmic copper chaperone A
MRWRATCGSCCSLLLLLLLAACGRAAADDVRAESGALVADGAWSRAADSGAATAVYFVLRNAGEVTDTLKGVRSEEADEVGLHVSMQAGQVMRMAPVTALPVPARDSVTFQPLGAHVMLTGLRRPLREGEGVRLMLEFASGATVAVDAVARSPR